MANLLTLGVELNPLVPAFVVSNFQDNLMVWLHTMIKVTLPLIRFLTMTKCQKL